MTKEQLLAEIEGILQAAPTWEDFWQKPIDSSAWLGRATALIREWDPTQELLARLNTTIATGSIEAQHVWQVALRREAIGACLTC